ncbi:MAG TPA: cytochrome c peroxidase [Longimicrobiales bacterium]
MTTSRSFLLLLAACVALAACSDFDPQDVTSPMVAKAGNDVDVELRALLAHHGFTGRIASTLEVRLGRRIDPQLAELGRVLFFDPIQGLNDDNACAGCHSPTHGFGDTQPIAIGIDNNRVVGAGRVGPRNQRRSPMIINTAFYPTLMWNSRFRARSGDPFDNGAGFSFPEPEALSLSSQPHLLTAQAFIPPTERVEAAGFHFPGNNEDIRSEVTRRLNQSEAYRLHFARVFKEIREGAPIKFDHFARAIAEFEFTQTYADAPIDRYGRGNDNSLTDREKLGALLFFGRAGCVQCHAVAGQSNEMFSDFREHVAGIPQIVPAHSNVVFDGPGGNEDFGLEQVTGDLRDRYAFRTSPLRNVALQPAFMHNGAFTRLEDAIRYHLDAIGESARYSVSQLPADLQNPVGPMEPVVLRIDARLLQPIDLTGAEFEALVAFVRYGLLDPNARAQRLRRFIPEQLPSGREALIFQSGS